MSSQTNKAKRFKALHQQGTFVMANFWDVGSAVMLEKLGFKALASTSAGFAQSIGKLEFERVGRNHVLLLEQPVDARYVKVRFYSRPDARYIEANEVQVLCDPGSELTSFEQGLQQ